MANVGIPQGGQFPSKGELNSKLSNFFAGGKEFAVDRRTLYGKQAGRIYSDSLGLDDAGFMGAGAYLNPKSSPVAEGYQAADDQTIEKAGGDQSAFVQRDIPTSSTNYARPRTVAAGYDAERQTMTVVFRDGTFYNYYEVTQAEWDAFRASYSKGNPWLNKANKNQASDGLFVNKPRGDAGDMTMLDPEVRAALYRVARTFQQKAPPKPGRTTTMARLASGERVAVRNVAKSTTSASRSHKAHTAPTNPATAGKPNRRRTK